MVLVGIGFVVGVDASGVGGRDISKHFSPILIS